jgi:hypothetical protein
MWLCVGGVRSGGPVDCADGTCSIYAVLWDRLRVRTRVPHQHDACAAWALCA